MATIFKRGSSWYLNLSERGRRIVRSLGPNEYLARLRLAEVQANIERGKAGFPMIERKSLGIRLQQFMDTHTAGKAPTTIVRYREMARHFLGFFGPNVELEASDLRRYITHRLAQGVRSKTVNNELIFIRTVYGPRGTHPFRGVENLTARDSKDVRFLSPDEAARLLLACDDGINREQWPDLGDYVAAYLYLGVRLAELGALTWADITPAGARVTNLKTFGRRRGDKYRLVPIHADLAPILERRRRLKPPLSCPYPQHHPNSLRRAIGRAAERAGIPGAVGVHTLRHTFASALVQRHVDLYTLSKLMGHSSQETTRIYSHLIPKTFESAVALLDYRLDHAEVS